MATDLLESAAHWEKIADEAEEMARWNRDHGLDLSRPGQSAGDYRAADYRRCARTLRAEHATGLPHCMCHEKPTRDCPNGRMGLRWRQACRHNKTQEFYYVVMPDTPGASVLPDRPAD